MLLRISHNGSIALLLILYHPSCQSTMIFAIFSSVGWLLEIGTDFRDYHGGGYSNSYLYFSKNERPSSSIYNHGSQKIEEVK